MADILSSAQKEMQKQDVAEWVERLARFGYAAKGVVYLLLGFLALQAAFSVQSTPDGTKDALQSLLDEPLGTVLLLLIAVGLAGYALWRLVQGIHDPEQQGDDAEGLAKRAGYIISGLLYGGLALTALQMVIGNGSGGGGSSTQDWTARVLSWPLGPWLVGLAGLAVLGYALEQARRAYTTKFRQHLKLHEMSHQEEEWATRAGRVGLAARSFVYALIGIFLLQAAINYNPEQAGGLGQVFSTLASQSYGQILLGLVALGLAAYGIYALVLARYRYIHPR